MLCIINIYCIGWGRKLLQSLYYDGQDDWTIEKQGILYTWACTHEIVIREPEPNHVLITASLCGDLFLVTWFPSTTIVSCMPGRSITPMVDRDTYRCKHIFINMCMGTHAAMYVCTLLICVMQGMYLNIDEFKSRFLVLSKLLGKKEASKNVFNQCSFA